MHKFIAVNLVYFFIIWMNAFPVKNGVSEEFSPRSIGVHTKLSWMQNCCIQFGDYAKVHDEPDPSNTLTPRTHPSMAVGTTDNFNGTVNCFCERTNPEA